MEGRDRRLLPDWVEGRATLSIDETARVTGLSRRTVERSVAAGALASIRIGRRRLIPRVQIDELVDKALASVASSGSGWGC